MLSQASKLMTIYETSGNLLREYGVGGPSVCVLPLLVNE